MKYLMLIGTLVAGSLLPVQTILNTRLGRQTGGFLVGVLLSFIVGTLCLLLINLFVSGNALVQLKPSKTHPWFLWLGGLIGAFFLSYTTWVNQKQGMALTFILIICGQILMSLLIDNYGLLGAKMQPVTGMKMAGVALILAGIFLIRK
ncbi:MAG TPA: DMT family transporter [Chitinophagaceae bacterium]|nr:DMT family transporter [Chitinophagaceae bacterium]